MTPHVQNGEARQNADEEQYPPRRFGGHKRKHGGEHQCGQAVPHGPAALHATDGPPSRARIDDLGHQHRACRPLPAESEPLETAEHDQLFVGVGEARQEREARKPENGQLQDFHAPVSIGKDAGEPSARRRKHERRRPKRACLRLAQRPQANERRHCDGIELHIHRIQRPAREARPERAALACRHFAEPVSHSSSFRARKHVRHHPRIFVRGRDLRIGHVGSRARGTARSGRL